jgi:HAMP domain-containing protein
MENQEVKGSIKTKILRIVLLVEILLTVVFVGIVIFSFQKNLQLSSLQMVMNIRGIYDSIMKNDTKMLSASLDIFSSNEAFKQLFEKKDRARLYAAGKELFTRNRDRYGITHFYYISSDDTCFLRMHKPELADDVIKRVTYLQAKATGKQASGIELGKTAFALRVVSPYYDKGQRIGYVEFGEEIDHFDQIVKEETESDVLVLVNKNLLNEQDYRLTRKNAKQRDDWDDLKNYALVSETFGDRPFFTSKIFKEDDIRSIRTSTFLGTVTYAGRVLMKGAFPITDASDKQVGTVIVLSNITSQVKNARAGIAYLVVAALGLLVLSSLLTFRYLKGEIIDPLVNLTNQAVEVSMGNVEKKMETERTDEIGFLIRSFDRMRTSLKLALSMIHKTETPPK